MRKMTLDDFKVVLDTHVQGTGSARARPPL